MVLGGAGKPNRQQHLVDLGGAGIVGSRRCRSRPRAAIMPCAAAAASQRLYRALSGWRIAAANAAADEIGMREGKTCRLVRPSRCGEAADHPLLLRAASRATWKPRRAEREVGARAMASAQNPEI